MRVNLYIVILVMLILTTSCVDGNNVDVELDSEEIVAETPENSISEVGVGYIIESSSYNYKDINVLFPTIKSDNPVLDEDRINEILEKEALSFVELLEESKATLFFELSYEVIYTSKDLLSISYYGSRYMEGGPYPVDIFFTTSIDLKKGQKLTLKDLVEIDNSFVEVFLSSIGEVFEDEMKTYALQYVKQSYSQERLLQGFSEADSTYGTSRYIFSYFTADSIGISWEVPHSVGDHVEVEISFDKLSVNLKDLIKKEMRSD